jgi:hypothetical protein
MKNALIWDVTPCGSRTDVSEELNASIIRVTRIGELGATFAATSNRHMLLCISSQSASVSSYS